MLFNFSEPKHPPASLSTCQATVSFSDSVRNLGFYLDKNLSMKEHISFICKTAFLEIRRTSTIRHYLTDCSSLLAGLPQSLVSKLKRVQNCVSCPVVVHLHKFTSPQYSDIFTGCLPEPEFPIRLHDSVSTPLWPTSVLSFSIFSLQCRHPPPQNSTL